MERKVRLKESVAIVKDNKGLYCAVFTAIRKIKRFTADNLVQQLLEITKTEIRYEEVLEKLGRQHKREDVISALNALEREGMLKVWDSDVPSRYLRQIMFLDELTGTRSESLNIQAKLRESTVSVFGIGGIGTWIVNGLYQIGIGHLRIVDADVVEESNINRQLYFTMHDVGRYKVDVITEKIPDANILPFRKRIDADTDLEEIIEGTDFIVDCADEPTVAETARIIDSYSSPRGIAYCIAGGYNLHIGMVGPIIIPGVTATFEDFLKHQQRNDPLSGFKVVKEVEDSGNLGPIAGAIANIQVMEIFKHLTGIGVPNYNRFAEINFLDFSVEWRKYAPQHHPEDTPD